MMWILKVTRPIGILFAMLTLNSIQLNPIQAAQLSSPTQPVAPVRLCNVAFSPDGKKIVSNSSEGHTYFWDIESAALQYDFDSGDNCAYLTFTADGQNLFTRQPGGMLGEDAVTILWDTQTGNEIRRFVGNTSVSENGQFVLVSGNPLSYGML